MAFSLLLLLVLPVVTISVLLKNFTNSGLDAVTLIWSKSPGIITGVLVFAVAFSTSAGSDSTFCM